MWRGGLGAQQLYFEDVPRLKKAGPLHIAGQHVLAGMPRGRAGMLLAFLLLALASLPQPSMAAYRLDGQGAAAAGVGPQVGAGATATPAGIAAFPTLWQYYDSLFPAEALIPTVETMRGHEVLYQVPEKTRATLFIAHGCSHAAHDWWPPSAACPQCLGLPEEVAQTQQALARGYAGKPQWEAHVQVARVGWGGSKLGLWECQLPPPLLLLPLAVWVASTSGWAGGQTCGRHAGQRAHPAPPTTAPPTARLPLPYACPLPLQSWL